MFDMFDSKFRSDTAAIDAMSVPPEIFVVDKCLGRLFERFGGQSFNNGIYRIIAPTSTYYWSEMISVAFPVFSGRITCFAVDWLGRVFAIDKARLEGGGGGVVMFEPGTGEALEVPCNIVSFHESELIDYSEEALAASFYNKWLACGGKTPTIKQCIGYKKPLFLGGRDSVDNLEVSDLDVYWNISAQLIRRIQGMPPGAVINKFSID